MRGMRDSCVDSTCTQLGGQLCRSNGARLDPSKVASLPPVSIRDLEPAPRILCTAARSSTTPLLASSTQPTTSRQGACLQVSWCMVLYLIAFKTARVLQKNAHSADKPRRRGISSALCQEELPCAHALTDEHLPTLPSICCAPKPCSAQPVWCCCRHSDLLCHLHRLSGGGRGGGPGGSTLLQDRLLPRRL